MTPQEKYRILRDIAKVERYLFVALSLQALSLIFAFIGVYYHFNAPANVQKVTPSHAQ